MFLQLSVCHSVHRGRVVVYPSKHWSRHPLGRFIPAWNGADIPPRQPLQWTVRILRERILVFLRTDITVPMRLCSLSLSVNKAYRFYDASQKYK